jgi:hypothetical protein
LVVKAGPNPPYGNLTSQDIFYVQVTRIQAFFGALLQTIESYAASETVTQAATLGVNKIVLSVLGEVAKFRDAKSDLFRAPEGGDHTAFEYLP